MYCLPPQSHSSLFVLSGRATERQSSGAASERISTGVRYHPEGEAARGHDNAPHHTELSAQRHRTGRCRRCLRRATRRRE